MYNMWLKPHIESHLHRLFALINSEISFALELDQ